MEIPAASLAGIDLNRIRDQYGSVADELMHIDTLMSSGNDSDQDFLRLIKLLLQIGERSKAKALLVANCKHGEPLEDLLRLEFPEVIHSYEKSIDAFAQQYRCLLKIVHVFGLLSNVYSCDAQAMQPDEQIAEILSHPAGSQVSINYGPEGFIYADLCEMSDSGKALPFRFDEQNWYVDHAYLESILRGQQS